MTDRHATLRAAARASGMCQVCLKQPVRTKPNGKPAAWCESCHVKHALPRQRQLPSCKQHYKPIDELLEMMSVRVMRAMRWFDWVTLDDLCVALDVEVPDRGPVKRAIRELVRLGEADQLDVAGMWTQYRLRPAGRSELQRQLARADVGVATEEEAA